MDLEPDPIYDPVSSLSHENPYPAYERLREDFPSNTSRVTTFGRCRGMRTSSRGYVIGRPFPVLKVSSWAPMFSSSAPAASRNSILRVTTSSAKSLLHDS